MLFASSAKMPGKVDEPRRVVTTAAPPFKRSRRENGSVMLCRSWCHFPVDAVPLIQQLIERNQFRLLTLPDGLKLQAVCFLQPSRGVTCLRRRLRHRIVFCLLIIRAILAADHLLGEALASHLGSEYQRPIHRCLNGLVIRQRSNMQFHGQRYFNFVSVMPGAMKFCISTRFCFDLLCLAVHLDGCAVGPVRNADVDAERSWV